MVPVRIQLALEAMNLEGSQRIPLGEQKAGSLLRGSRTPVFGG